MRIRTNPLFPNDATGKVMSVLWRELATTVNDIDSKINAAVPASATASGTPGMIAYDSSFLYICVGVNQWKRVGLSTW
jgi:hypothetical protein